MTATVLYKNVEDDVIENIVKIETLVNINAVQLLFDEEGHRMVRLIYLDPDTKVMLSE